MNVIKKPQKHLSIHLEKIFQHGTSIYLLIALIVRMLVHDYIQLYFSNSRKERSLLQ